MTKLKSFLEEINDFITDTDYIVIDFTELLRTFAGNRNHKIVIDKDFSKVEIKCKTHFIYFTLYRNNIERRYKVHKKEIRQIINN